MNDILIIPDVHGRKFWKEATNRYPDADTIFLGDYHDPYPNERITTRESLDNFIEIIEYARLHPNIHLLLGNHDLHYICSVGKSCRLDRENFAEIRRLYYDNLRLFSLMTHREVSAKTVVFTHAPVLNNWLVATGQTADIMLIERYLNTLLLEIDDNPQIANTTLDFTSVYRGGYSSFGSPVWADVRELSEDAPPIPTADFSIFGHTQVIKPIITDYWACLDCQKAFLLNEQCWLTEI